MIHRNFFNSPPVLVFILCAFLTACNGGDGSSEERQIYGNPTNTTPVPDTISDNSESTGFPSNPGSCDARFQVARTGIASSVRDDGLIGLAIPIENETDDIIPAVQVTEIKVSNAITLAFTAPMALGDIGTDAVALISAEIEDRDGHPNKKYHVIVSGTYRDGQCTFTAKDFFSPIARSDDEIFPSRDGVVSVQSPLDAIYTPPQDTDSEGPNAESPIMIPPGPFRQLFQPTPMPSDEATPGGALVEIDVNLNSSSNNAGTPPDPNAARDAGGVVLATFNTGISYSLDGGISFTDVNLFVAWQRHLGTGPARPHEFFPAERRWVVLRPGGDLCPTTESLRVVAPVPNRVHQDAGSRWRYNDYYHAAEPASRRLGDTGSNQRQLLQCLAIRGSDCHRGRGGIVGSGNRRQRMA